MLKDAPVVEFEIHRRRRKRLPKDVVTVPGLEVLVALRAIIVKLQALEMVASEDVRDKAADHFIEKGQQIKGRPESFLGVEGIATALLSLRTRSENYPLDDETAALLDGYELPYETIDVEPESWVINPAYDSSVRERAEKALTEANIPQDFLLRRPGRSVRVVSKDALEELFKKHLHDDALRTLFRAVSSIAIVPRVSEHDIAALFRIVEKALGLRPLPARPTVSRTGVKKGKRKGRPKG